MRNLAQSIDQRYWEREDEIRHENQQKKPAFGNGSNNSASSSNNNYGRNKNRISSTNSSSNQQSSSSGSSFTHSAHPSNSAHRSNHPVTRPNIPGPSSSSRPPASAPLTDKLGKDGKLTPEERKRRLDNKLCLFCRQGGHTAANCPKSSSNASKAKACAVQVASSSDPPSDSKK